MGHDGGTVAQVEMGPGMCVRLQLQQFNRGSVSGSEERIKEQL